MKKFVLIAILAVFALSCSQSEKFDKEKYLNEGKEIAQATGKTLVGHVKKAIQESGPFEAINFCKLSAYPITDSLSQLYHVQINRVAIKNRNPKNKAEGKDADVIHQYMEQMAKGEKIKPVVEKQGEKIVFYAPIKLQHACLTCHGKPQTEIPDTLYKHIRSLYPEDIAVDFKEGDLRAVWKLVFDEEK